jgi:periplasmic protein TonB
MTLRFSKQAILTASGVLLAHAVMLVALHHALAGRQEVSPHYSLSRPVAIAPAVQRVQLLAAQSEPGGQRTLTSQNTGKRSGPAELPIPQKPTAAKVLPEPGQAVTTAAVSTTKVDTTPPPNPVQTPNVTATLSPVSPSVTMKAGTSGSNATNAVSTASPGPAGTRSSEGSTGAAKSEAAQESVQLPDAYAQYLHNPIPDYPRRSRELNEQGRVVLKVWVTAAGTVQRSEVVQSSGYERLDYAARTGVQDWKFVPGKRNGKTEAMTVLVPIPFYITSP